MTIEERLYQLLSPFVTRLSPITPEDLKLTPFTVWTIVAQNPMDTMAEGTVTGLRHWEIQFCTYGPNYNEIQAQTNAIVDFLLPYRDEGIKVCLLKRRRTILDLHVHLPE